MGLFLKSRDQREEQPELRVDIYVTYDRYLLNIPVGCIYIDVILLPSMSAKRSNYRHLPRQNREILSKRSAAAMV
jgi:hypothetical protein